MRTRVRRCVCACACVRACVGVCVCARVVQGEISAIECDLFGLSLNAIISRFEFECSCSRALGFQKVVLSLFGGRLLLRVRVFGVAKGFGCARTLGGALDKHGPRRSWSQHCRLRSTTPIM